MSFDTEKLYSLLPAVYRIRDIELAEQMENLLTPAERPELQSYIRFRRLLQNKRNVSSSSRTNANVVH